MLMAAEAMCAHPFPPTPPPTHKDTKPFFLCWAVLGGKWVHCVLEFRMSRQLYILRPQGHQQIDRMKGFRADWAEL